ncbi:hypothetical protein SBOR_1154 [Sclerotinia borealis F-4128]|uniref:Uncharacterized protein n=1 Tax=Sclerotinia borealis (strain F-4128) TaxID=1432307 RepID=W9CNV8_SCLBF|nr:hypothetical protein SBOR_1154 [Sclerotinia borealis F-4128]
MFRRLRRSHEMEIRSQITRQTTESHDRWLNKTNWYTVNQIEFREFLDISCDRVTPEHLRVVTEEKHAILKKFMAENDGREKSALKLLQRLEIPTPDVTKNYELTPTLLDGFTFRLASDNLAKFYLVVSYCWSPTYEPIRGQKIILCYPDETGPGSSPKLPFSPILSERSVFQYLHFILTDTPLIYLLILLIPSRNCTNLPDIYLSTSRKIIRILTVFSFSLDPTHTLVPDSNIISGVLASIAAFVFAEMWEKASLVYCTVGLIGCSMWHLNANFFRMRGSRFGERRSWDGLSSMGSRMGLSNS